MKKNIHFLCYTGLQIIDLIPEIAKLRIAIFAEYPFLYIGDYEYETQYLQKFLKIQEGIVVVAFDGDLLIGLATGYPFIYESSSLQQVFLSANKDPKEYFCFGESVLLKPYRGLGIGKTFLTLRENHVRKLNHYRAICFYTRIRPANDPLKPPNYIPLDPLWKKQGFVKHPDLIGKVSYQEIGEKEETDKEMVFWIKEL